MCNTCWTGQKRNKNCNKTWNTQIQLTSSTAWDVEMSTATILRNMRIININCIMFKMVVRKLISYFVYYRTCTLDQLIFTKKKLFATELPILGIKWRENSKNGLKNASRFGLCARTDISDLLTIYFSIFEWNREEYNWRNFASVWQFNGKSKFIHSVKIGDFFENSTPRYFSNVRMQLAQN